MSSQTTKFLKFGSAMVAILLAGALAVAGFALAAALPPSQPSPPASFLVPTAP